MALSSLRRWLRRPGKAARRGMATRPGVEQLEDRCLLSTLQAISLPPPGQPPSDTAAGPSFAPSVSADGRYVAFASTAPNLVPGQTAGANPFFPPGPNVYLLDRNASSVTLVSHLPGAPAAESGSLAEPSQPLLSRDGRFVAYVAGADVIGDRMSGTAPNNVLAFDRTTGQNTLVSHTNVSPTTPTSSNAFLEAISPNGRYIAFRTQDTDVVPNEVDNFGGQNLYLYDQAAQVTYLVTHVAGQNTTAEGYARGGILNPTVSVADDGTVVYLDTDNGGQLISGQTGNTFSNVYLYSPATQTNQLISSASGDATHTQAVGNCGQPLISEDASTVVFVSPALNLVPGQVPTTGGNNVFRYVRAPQTMTLVSGSGGSATTGGNAPSGSIGPSTYAIAVTPDGRFVAFVSQATDLIAGQGGTAGNVFLYDAQGPSLTLLSGVAGSATVGAGGDATLLPPGTPSGIGDPISEATTTQALSLSDDGSLVAFVSQANDIAPGETGPPGNDNIFLYSKAQGGTRLVTGVHGSATATDAGQSGFPTLSGDGSLLAFHSIAVDLGSGFFDGNGTADVFTYSTTSQGFAVASRAAFQQTAPGNSYTASVSGDGRYTVYTSTAEDLVPNQTTVNDNQNVFLFDKQTGTNTLVNHVPGLPDTTGDGGIPFTFGQRPQQPQLPVVSADGSTVAFTTADDNLVSGEPLGSSLTYSTNVYLYGVLSGQARLVNHASGNDAQPNLQALAPALSADGRFVAYVLGSSVTGPSGLGQGAIALYDSMTDTTTMITTLDSMNQGTASDPTISDNGQFVSYLEQGQVYVYDRVTGKTVLASHDNSSPTSTTPANGASGAPVLSHDGSAVAFTSAATNLVPGQASNFTNVFLYKNDTSGGDAVGPVLLVSGAGGSATAGGDGNSDSPAIDFKGDYVAYRSDADNLVAGQAGATGNVFEFNTQTNTQVLVSHQAGAPAAGAGGSSQPVIDDDGHLVGYASTAGNLIPGQSRVFGVAKASLGRAAGPGPPGPGLPVFNPSLRPVENVFLWLRQTNANILASGQDGSPTVTGNDDSDHPVLTRDSFPVFSSVATNLVNGIGGTSVAYLNTLVALSLAPNTIALGSPAGSVVGNLSVSSLLAGQYLPPVYSLPAGEGSNSLFALGGTAGGQAPLLIAFSPALAGSFAVRVHVNVGFGDDAVGLTVFTAAAAPGGGFVGGPGGPVPVVAELVSVRVGKRKARLMIEVFDPLTGAEVGALVSPFQAPAYRGITLTPLGPGLYRLSARKGKHAVSILLHA